MRCAVLALTQAQALQGQIAVEAWGEGWQAEAFFDASAAYDALCVDYFETCLLCPCPEAEDLARRLAQRPPVAPPWVVRSAAVPPAGMPPEAMRRLPQVTCLGRALTRALTVRPGLRADAFLPDMAALAVVHPPLLADLKGRLYPLVARRHGITPAAVERDLRTLVESTWSRGDLAALERFFGHSVDPEKGKPTNKAFLCQLQQKLTLAARRLV